MIFSCVRVILHLGTNPLPTPSNTTHHHRHHHHYHHHYMNVGTTVFCDFPLLSRHTGTTANVVDAPHANGGSEDGGAGDKKEADPAATDSESMQPQQSTERGKGGGNVEVSLPMLVSG